MDINKMKSNLRMEKFYFSKCSIERNEVVEDGKYDIELQKKIVPLENHRYKVELKTEVRKGDMELNIVAIALFVFDAQDYSKEADIIKANTVAIMFPFVRSQVTLMTSQPGMSPVVIPTINTTKFVEN